MYTSKSQRITVSGRNLQFLQSLAEQMDETNLSEVLRYLLCDVRCLGYVIGSKQPQPTAQPQQTSLGYAFDPTTFERVAPIPEVDRNYSQDPIIARMASLIEDF